MWSAIFLTYKMLILLVGVYMSWKVRKVYTRKLVDAQYCATLLLLAVPFCVLGLIFAYTIRLYPTPHYAMVGIIIIIYTYIVLGFLYGHKVLYIMYSVVSFLLLFTPSSLLFHLHNNVLLYSVYVCVCFVHAFCTTDHAINLIT